MVNTQTFVQSGCVTNLLPCEGLEIIQVLRKPPFAEHKLCFVTSFISEKKSIRYILTFGGVVPTITGEQVIIDTRNSAERGVSFL